LSHAAWDKGFHIDTFLKMLSSIRPQNGSVYICTSHMMAPAIWDWMGSEKTGHYSYIVWCKPNPMPSLAKRHFTWATELICYATFGNHVFNFPEEGHALSWWNIASNSANRLHPTQKPLDVPKQAILHSSNKGDLVFDGFLGSGTTLIAAERTGRICYGCEISPI
jgi:DNA modification methylase